MPQFCSLATKRISAFVGASLILTGAAFADFKPLAGNWTGGGTINMANGNTEKVRCRATYTVDSGGVSVTQNLNCASSNTNVNIVSNVALNGSAVVGNWTESTRGVSGQLRGQISGSNISATISGPGFGANLVIGTSGSNQNINLGVNGGDVSGVSLSLKKN